MSTKRTTEEDAEEATQGPKSFAALCESMMAARKPGSCAGQMQEMMSRCMAAFSDKQEETK